MKFKITLLAVIILIFSNSQNLQAQCPTHILNLGSQGLVDTFFMVNYPLCTKLTHRLIVHGSSVTNLNGLSQIKEATELEIKLSSISDLTGLNNLRKVGEFNIRNNDQLMSMDGIESLDTIDRLLIHYNDLLSTVSDLANLDFISSSLLLVDLPMLQNLTGLEDVTFGTSTDPIGVYVRNNNMLTDLQGLPSSMTNVTTLSIQDNQTLQNLAGLENLQLVTNHFYLVDNSSLQSISELHNLENIGGVFSITRNPLLTGLQPLAKLNTVGGIFLIRESNALLNLDGLNNLDNVGGFHISNNDALLNLEGLNNLTLIRDELDLSENDALVNCSGLDAIDTIGTLNIVNNRSLINLAGMESLRSVDNILIEDNQALENLIGLNGLTNISQDFTLTNNDVLLNLVGLNSLQNISRDFIIENNDLLENLSGLNNLDNVGDSEDDKFSIISNGSLSSLIGMNAMIKFIASFKVEDNNSLGGLSGLDNIVKATDIDLINNNLLSNLDPLSNLDTITGALTIAQNQNLIDISAFDNLDDYQILSRLFVEDNHSLMECNSTFVCDYISTKPQFAFISGNLGDCFSKEDVFYACGCSDVISIYRDGDNDGYGRTSNQSLACADFPIPSSYSTIPHDCNDSNPNNVDIEVFDPFIYSGFYKANRSIISDTYIAWNGGNNKVTFKAGEKVTLLPSFDIEQGATFNIIIGDCP